MGVTATPLARGACVAGTAPGTPACFLGRRAHHQLRYELLLHRDRAAQAQVELVPCRPRRRGNGVHVWDDCPRLRAHHKYYYYLEPKRRASMRSRRPPGKLEEVLVKSGNVSGGTLTCDRAPAKRLTTSRSCVTTSLNSAEKGTGMYTVVGKNPSVCSKARFRPRWTPEPAPAPMTLCRA